MEAALRGIAHAKQKLSSESNKNVPDGHHRVGRDRRSGAALPRTHGPRESRRINVLRKTEASCSRLNLLLKLAHGRYHSGDKFFACVVRPNHGTSGGAPGGPYDHTSLFCSTKPPRT